MNRRPATMAVLIVTLVVGALVVGLSACANSDSNAEDTPVQPAEQPQGEPTEPPPPPAPRRTTVVEMRVGDTHTIPLGSNPTTGYQWEIGFEFDERYMELVERRYEPGSSAVGAGGRELFTFRALAHGTVEFSFNYKRPSEDEVLQSERYIFNIGVDAALAEEMSEAEAREIAMTSECGKEGALKENAFYNDWSGAWWIDLDIKKEGCSPACVVNAATKQAEINWRCTGALPPK